MADTGSTVGRPLSETQSNSGISLSVQSHEALAQPTVGLGNIIPDQLRGLDRLIKVRNRCRVIATLRGVPHKLSHQSCGLGYCGQQVPPYPSDGCVVAKEGDAPVEPVGLTKQGRSRCPVIDPVKFLHLYAQVRRR